ncbi:MAG: ABC transporter ATP-binding protein [Nanoarchaeota archaeon]|nr:ABC transporter ATP-binding protein [Nanoarchaeota archaeon]
MIRLDNVVKTYVIGEDVQVHAVRGISLEVKKGEFMALVGPSGCGKSTLMNLIGALDIPTEGRIFLENRDIAKMSESALAHVRGRKIGFIFQQFNLITNLDALGNVMLPMIFQGIPEQKRKARATKLLHLVGLGDRMNHKPNELSGGQQQRVAIARSLANNPDMILADEPTGNLDSKSGKQIMELLGELHFKQGKTIVMVTHDLHLVDYAHRVIHLKDGLILKERTISKNHHHRR